MPEVVTRLRQHKAAQQRRLLERGVRATAVDLVCDRGDGHHFDPDAYTHAVARVAGAAGTPGVRLHDLRHGAATFWLKEQGERPEVVSRMLGHSSVAFTLSTYVHPDADDLDALATRAGEAMFGTAG
jgi:integrase